MKKSNPHEWYVLQVIGGKENTIEQFIQKLETESLKAFLPQKKLKIRKMGKTRDVIKPLYPGYIFVIGKWNIKDAKKITQLPGAVKFIGGLFSPGTLQIQEKEIINKITKEGIAGYSQVIKEGSKIKIISGPLKELEGVIQSVDRRKQKAIVNLLLLNSVVKVTLGFEYMESNENKNN
jgi:transcription termination/antitermination protein NusG